MYFEIVGQITEIEVIVSGRGVRASSRLRKRYGGVRWRKIKGVATIRLGTGHTHLAQLHWYEARGVGRKGLIKRFLD
jgi:hypothetical protein